MGKRLKKEQQENKPQNGVWEWVKINKQMGGKHHHGHDMSCLKRSSKASTNIYSSMLTLLHKAKRYQWAEGDFSKAFALKFPGRLAK